MSESESLLLDLSNTTAALNVGANVSSEFLSSLCSRSSVCISSLRSDYSLARRYTEKLESENRRLKAELKIYEGAGF